MLIFKNREDALNQLREKTTENLVSMKKQCDLIINDPCAQRFIASISRERKIATTSMKKAVIAATLARDAIKQVLRERC